MALRKEDLAKGTNMDLGKLINIHDNDLNYFETLEKMAKKSMLAEPPKLTKEQQKAIDKKVPLYGIYEYSDKDLRQARQIVRVIAAQNGGLPMNGAESLLKEKKAWMRAYLFGYDHLTSGRWTYWSQIIEKGTIEGSGPIPQIDWCTNESAIHQVRKMLADCVNGVHHYGGNVTHFADWLLWALEGHGEPPVMDSKIADHFYKTFDLFLVLKYPIDYLSGLLEEVTSRGHAKALGYFSTPPQITQLMTTMMVMNDDPEEMKRKSVYDGCIGCGAMLLPMSNYSFFGYGQDINPDAVKFCKIQFFWYAPWFAANPFPKP